MERKSLGQHRWILLGQWNSIFETCYLKQIIPVGYRQQLLTLAQNCNKHLPYKEKESAS